jgi:hypothetical protein
VTAVIHGDRPERPDVPPRPPAPSLAVQLERVQLKPVQQSSQSAAALGVRPKTPQEKNFDGKFTTFRPEIDQEANFATDSNAVVYENTAENPISSV